MLFLIKPQMLRDDPYSMCVPCCLCAFPHPLYPWTGTAAGDRLGAEGSGHEAGPVREQAWILLSAGRGHVAAGPALKIAAGCEPVCAAYSGRVCRRRSWRLAPCERSSATSCRGAGTLSSATLTSGPIIFVHRYDTAASGNWYKADEPWGAFLQTDGNPAVTVHPYESDPSSGSFNPQAHTTWVPVDWSSWPNYNVHGYGVY